MARRAAVGSAATRLEAFVTNGGAYAYGVVPEIEELFQRQARELDPRKREATLGRIQEMLRDRTGTRGGSRSPRRSETNVRNPKKLPSSGICVTFELSAHRWGIWLVTTA